MTYTPPLTGTTPEIRERQKIEHSICESLVRELLSHGFRITVDDGESNECLTRSTDLDTILKAMFSVDDERLYVCTAEKDTYFGWVRLIYGNDGFDVICDYTTNLTEKIRKTNEYADEFMDRTFPPKWWE